MNTLIVKFKTVSTKTLRRLINLEIGATLVLIVGIIGIATCIYSSDEFCNSPTLRWCLGALGVAKLYGFTHFTSMTTSALVMEMGRSDIMSSLFWQTIIDTGTWIVGVLALTSCFSNMATCDMMSTCVAYCVMYIFVTVVKMFVQLMLICCSESVQGHPSKVINWEA